MVGGIEVCDILESPGDLREDWEDVDCISAREDEFLRVEPEVLDADLSLREKSPILAVLIGYRWGGWCELWMYLYGRVGNQVGFDNQIFGRSLVTMSRGRCCSGIGRGHAPIGELTGAEIRLLARLN